MWLLLFVIWWLANWTLPAKERLWGFAAFLIGTVATVALTLNTLQPMGALFTGLPFVLTLWTLWLVVSGKMSPAAPRSAWWRPSTPCGCR